MPTRTSDLQRPIAVKFFDPDSGKSKSITVYGSSLHQVGEYAERCFKVHWKTTSLSDRRHKRRL